MINSQLISKLNFKYLTALVLSCSAMSGHIDAAPMEPHITRIPPWDNGDFLSWALENWINEGGTPENRENREIAAERILETYGLRTNPGEVTDMRFRPADLLLENLNLTSLPNIFGLNQFRVRLLVVNLEGNQLTSLPETFAKLTSLQVLNLNENKFSKLPSQLNKLTNLRVLTIAGNQIKKLPEKIGELVNLEELALQSNQLVSLPESMGNLIHLKHLDISNNQLTEEPHWIDNLTKLTYYNCEGNPFSAIPE